MLSSVPIRKLYTIVILHCQTTQFCKGIVKAVCFAVLWVQNYRYISRSAEGVPETTEDAKPKPISDHSLDALWFLVRL